MITEDAWTALHELAGTVGTEEMGPRGQGTTRACTWVTSPETMLRTQGEGG